MSDHVSNTTINELVARFHASNRILITTHAKPDGDAMGSALALQRALAGMGKSAHIALIGPFEPNLRAVARSTPITLVESNPPPGEFDLIVIVDTSAFVQLEPLTPWLRTQYERAIVIDHHTRGDDVAKLRYVQPQQVSTTAVLVPILDALGCPLTGGLGGIAEALFLGLATDSGWFRFGNAGADAFALAARLLAAGVNKSALYALIEENHRPERLALEARALASLRYVNDGTIAIQLLRAEDFTQTGGSVEDLGGVVNLPMIVGRVRASILLSQTSPELTKASFRSKPGPPEYPNDFINVNEFAANFGGGGHVHAAGAKLKTDIDQALTQILTKLQNS